MSAPLSVEGGRPDDGTYLDAFDRDALAPDARQYGECSGCNGARDAEDFAASLTHCRRCIAAADASHAAVLAEPTPSESCPTCALCGSLMVVSDKLAGPYCDDAQCPRRGAVILPPLFLPVQASWYPVEGTRAAKKPPTLTDRLRWLDYASNEYEAAETGSEREAHFKERYEQEHAAILALFAVGQRDTARLDQMQEHAASATAVMDMDPEAEIGYRVTAYDTATTGEGATLRDAIDAAFAGPTP